jgi:hypothetical protein
MKDVEEQRVGMKFCFESAETFTETLYVEASLWGGLFNTLRTSNLNI